MNGDKIRIMQFHKYWYVGLQHSTWSFFIHEISRSMVNLYPMNFDDDGCFNWEITFISFEKTLRFSESKKRIYD